MRPSVSTTDLINNIGRPLDNTSAFVIDPNDTNIMPRGAVGELCFGGYQVFKGYLNQPDLTAAKIIQHPHYGRIYRSGDLGILLEDDSILFMGRLDDQVKIRGQRVELGEITSALLDRDDVRDCSAILLTSDGLSDRLVIFWVPIVAATAEFNVLNLRAFRPTILDMFASLSDRLPSYMVPSHLIPISRLPMTAQGKIDTRLLRQCFAGLDEELLNCSTNCQDTIKDANMADIWEIKARDLLADTLHISPESIRRSSSFFALGLDSVSAISLSNAFRKAGLGEFSITTILKHPTIAFLAAAGPTGTSLNRHSGGPTVQPEEALSPDEISRIRQQLGERSQFCKIRPCTPLQEAMLSIGGSNSRSWYTNAMVFTVHGDLRRLQDSWVLMLERHEILRTSFIATDDPSHAWVQVTWKNASIEWGTIDFSTRPRQQADEMVANLMKANKPPVWLAIGTERQTTSLLFCCHHALYDGTAMQTLLDEIQDVYHSRELLPPVSYDLYLQQMLCQDLAFADQFWTRSFEDFEPSYFPDLTGKIKSSQHEQATWQTRLQLPLSEIRQACQIASLSLLSVVQATWAKLLHFYTGETDVCFGNVVSGRAFPGHELDRLVAPCFNTLPVRLNFDFQKENGALAEQIHTFNINSLDYQLTPLRRIQKLVVHDGRRLFDTLVILQQPNEPLDKTIWTLKEDSGDMDLPLVCEITQSQSEDSLDVTLHYCNSIISAAEAKIIASTFECSLEDIIKHPHAPANDTICLHSQLRGESNLDYKRAKSETTLLHHGFESNAMSSPNRIALDFMHIDGSRTTWAYKKLNERANNIAHALIGSGVKPDDIVPIHISKSPLFYASILGVLKAGAAFAPLHPGLPEARKALMLEQLGAKVILSSKELSSFRTPAPMDVLDVQGLHHSTDGNPVTPQLSATNLAYCLFTSGSTGTPKAVSMEHRAPVQTIESSRTLIPWKTSSRLLQYAAVTFDMCYYDCFLAWSYGFTLCAAEQHLMLDELPQVVDLLNTDLLDLTPTVAATLTRHEIPKVKWLYCIGEAMTQGIVEAWGDACINSYGPTEAAFCTTMHPISNEFKTAVIGRPFSSTSFAVFCANGERPLPVLSVGELYIGGAQLARGYVGAPDLTEEKFVSKCGQRFYRSGDMVRMLSDGNFEFIGRTDDQVKIRGLRVELGEINHTLQSSHPYITSAITQILKKDASAKEQLVAFLVTNRPYHVTTREEIQRQLRQRAQDLLPTYMVPQFFLFIDSIPRSLAGKVDKKALIELFLHSVESTNLTNGTYSQDVNHQWTDVESHVREVIARLSRTTLEGILPTTTIYQLGLDSISAVQIAAALRRRGYGLNSGEVMKYLTCVDIAAHINLADTSRQQTASHIDFASFDDAHRSHVLTAHDLADEDVEAILPCTPLQKGIVSQMLAKHGEVYINYLRMRLQQDVSLERMRKAWQRAMETHPMLRTGFAHLQHNDHSFVMIEYRPDAVILPWDIVSHNNVSESAQRWVARLRKRAADDLHRPLWQIRVVPETDAAYLDLAIFHALFDAQSLQRIFQDVVAAYHDQHIQPTAAVGPVVDGILQRGNDHDGQGSEFWAELGQQATPCRFPNLCVLRSGMEPPMICTHRSAESLHNMESACRRANTTMQAVGIASWLSLIAAYTGEPAATCGVVLAGRTFDAAENAVFPCINTIPFSHTMTLDLKNTLERITKLLAGVQQHQHVPLNNIQKLMGHPNEPLFDSIFAYQKLPLKDGEIDLWTIVDEEATIEYPVSIELEPIGDRLEYRLTIMPHTIPRQQTDMMLMQLDHLMQRFLSPTTSPELFDKSIYSVTPAKEPILSSEIRLLHEFVEESATKYPQRVALEFADRIDKSRCSARSWTYHELDIEGNKIAHLLINNGVHPRDIVGVCFDKCPEASFAILGVLKAGCAFVAIDPGAPAARQRFIVQDSGARAVLSMRVQSAKFAKDVHVPVLNLDETTTKALYSSRPVLERHIDPQDRSYCLYTSGTTGTPKGCELTHENAVQALLSFQRIFAGHWDPTSRWLQFASFHFDVSVLEQYWSWSVGICVVSAPRDVILEDLATSISTLGITHIDLTPSLAQLVHPDQVPSLCEGVFITGGESLKQEILDVWGPKAVIYNGYGPTEATIGCTMYPRVPAEGKPSNIGWQFDNVGTLVLLPDSDVPALRGGVGELCISGKLVGKGYLNRKELTEKSFPYLERFTMRVYRTGDLVRILHDGTFEFLGRADDQVKLRGQRLEVGEINSVIRRSDRQITDVATLVLKHPRQQKEQLVSFIVYSRQKGEPSILIDNPFDVPKAKEACHIQLPPYMVPTHFICLTSLPLNVNNKADAKRLKNMYSSLSPTDLQKLSLSSNEHDQAWSDPEQKIRNVASNEFNVDKAAVGKNTSFFELGMDSISVIGLVRGMKEADFGGTTASLVMSHPTVRRLARAISTDASTVNTRASLLAARQAIAATQHRHRRTVARSLAINTSEVEALAPCTPLQQGMIARSLESENGLYFNTFHIELGHNMDLRRFRAAWEAAFDSFQILRTVFANTEDGYVQAVLSNVDLPWIVDATIKRESSENHLARLRSKWVEVNQQNLTRPFELVLISNSGQQLLLVHIFHGLYDGISIELIFKAVWDVYNGLAFDKDAPDFFSALANGPLRVIAGAKEFWQKHLTCSSPYVFPSLTLRSSDEPVKVIRELRDLSLFEAARRKLNVTAQAVAQACWLHVLLKHIKNATTIGIVVSGRSIDLEGSDRIVGPMFNTIPYQHHPQRGETWVSFIRRVHDFNVAAHPYQHTALRDIAKWCRTDHRQPLFDTLFVYQVKKAGGWADNEMWKLLDSNAVGDYPLALEVEQAANHQWKLTLVAQGHIADVPTSNRLLDSFEEVLHQAIQDPTMMTDATTDTNDCISSGTSTGTHQTNGLYRMSDFEWIDSAKILREVLSSLTGSDVEEINETTTIFELGLDSIDAIKMSSDLKRHNVDLAVSGIMRGLNIAGMLPNIRSISDTKQRQESTEARLVTLKAELLGHVEDQTTDMTQVESILPLTPLQEGMAAEMVASDFARYYNFDVMKLSPETDKDRLRDAWTQVVGASPILRTSFIEIEDPNIKASFAQVIHVQSHDFWSQRRTDKEPDFPALFKEFRERAIESSLSEPLLHVVLVDAPANSYIVLAIAHALYDGWSLGLLHTDVASAYEGRLEHRPCYHPTLSTILSTSETDAVAFWGDYLFEARPSTFSPGSQLQATASKVTHRLERSSNVNAHDVTQFAKKSHVSLQTLGQTVFAVVLASYLRTLDVTFGSVLSGRDDEMTLQLMFPTMNTVAIRTILHGNRLELLRHVQDSFMNVKQYQHFPLRKVLALADAHGGLFESLFVYQKSVDTDEKDRNHLYTSVEGHSDVEYPVCVEMEVVEGELKWRCAVRSDVFDERGAVGLLNRLNNVLEEIMQRPDNPVIDFTVEGTSVCGLPPFEDDKASTSLLESKSSEQNGSLHEGLAPFIQTIRQVLASVSGTPEDEITHDTTVFHIGLDSISAIKVCSLLRKRDIILGVSDMLQAGTISSMARLLDARPDVIAEDDVAYEWSSDKFLRSVDREEIKAHAVLAGVPIANSDRMHVLPVTAGQQYMLSMWLNTKGSNMYNEFEYTLSGRFISLEELRNAWRALVAANPILRTWFFATSNPQFPYVQVVGANDWQSQSSEVLDELSPSHAPQHSIVSQPWVHLYKTQATSDGCDLKLKIHHALYDGISLPMMMQQLQDLCNGVKAPLPNGRFTKLILQQCTSSAIESRKVSWTRYLSGVKQSHLPQPNSTGLRRLEIFNPSWVSTDVLEETARNNGVSWHALFLAAYAELYAALTNNPETPDVVIGVYLANRSHDTSLLAAVPTVNLLPLRVRPFYARVEDLIASARDIQKDLQEISSPSTSSANLYEISEWTGINVDTFVNFLTLPDSDTQGPPLNDNNVRIVAMQAGRDQWSKPRCEVVERSAKFTPEDGDILQKYLVKEEVNRAYLVSCSTASLDVAAC